jgi:hypothetical protein
MLYEEDEIANNTDLCIMRWTKHIGETKYSKGSFKCKQKVSFCLF